MKNIKRSLYTAAIGLMLVAQLIQPANVFADGASTGTPMPTSTPEVTATSQATETVVETALPSGTPENTVTPEETTSPTDVPAVTLTPGPNVPTAEPVAETPIPTGFATPGAGEPTIEPVATTPALTEAPTEEEDETKVAPTDTSPPTAEPVVSEENSIVEEPSLGEVLSEIPAETEVVVLDENGQPEPLATVEAAEAVSSGNPVWCPVGQIPGGPGCTTTTYVNLSDLVANFIPTSDGTIYIAPGSDSSTSAIVINGDGNWAAASNLSLTIQGGWSGTTSSAFTVPISITNWNNTVTVNDITVTNASATGLTVITSGNINLQNVTVTGSKHTSAVNQQTNGNGVYLDNRSSTNHATVTISGTNVFSNNEAHGLLIWSYGTISIHNLTANRNGCNGADIGYIDNDSHNGSGDITITGENHIEDNGEGCTGTNIVTAGNITIDNLHVSGNQWLGAYVSNSAGTGNITITNSSFNNNIGASGLMVASNGNITLTDISANYNTKDGVEIYTPGNATVTGQIFEGNGSYQIDASAVCKNFSRLYSTPPTQIENNNYPTEGLHTYQDLVTGEWIQIYCQPTVIVDVIVTEISPLQNQGDIDLDCSKQAEFPRKLPNGDLVNIFCPVSGTASISRLDNTGLPANLPEGYTYASAFTLDIKQKGVLIPVINEGGYVKSSFVAQPLQPGNTYTVLYWDPWINENGDLVENPAGGSWVPLKDFLFDADLDSFKLFPDTDDPRRVISGVNLVSQSNVDRVEVSTNFPGIFVLAQH